jgi:pimeloyl-ACP methyl ester carboxylesterase
LQWTYRKQATRAQETSGSLTRSRAKGPSTSSSFRHSSHAEVVWNTSFAPSLHRLSSFCRLIRFDKRGTGLSDRVSGAPSLETRMDDARAVMDAVGSSRAAFFGSSEGAAMSALFAATYPERTTALVLRSAYPRTLWAPDYPWGRSEEAYRREMERDLRLFGSRAEALMAVRSRGLEFTDDDEAHAPSPIR